MRRGWRAVLVIGSVLTMASGGAYARDYGNGRYGGFGRQAYAADPAAVTNRVLRDLYGTARGSYVDRHERAHFDRAISALQAFQQRWARRGDFRSSHLDRAIDNMKHLANARQMHPGARRLIARDIEVLRDLRAQRNRFR
jgi:hypothetical protein